MTRGGRDEDEDEDEDEDKDRKGSVPWGRRKAHFNMKEALVRHLHLYGIPTWHARYKYQEEDRILLLRSYPYYCDFTRVFNIISYPSKQETPRLNNNNGTTIVHLHLH